MPHPILTQALEKIATGRYRKVRRSHLTELEHDGYVTLDGDQVPTITPHGYRAMNKY